MVAASILQALGAGGGSAARAAAIARRAGGATVLRARARFHRGSRGAVQCRRPPGPDLSRETFRQPAGGAAALVFRRGAPPPVLGRDAFTPSAALPAGAGG